MTERAAAGTPRSAGADPADGTDSALDRRYADLTRGLRRAPGGQLALRVVVFLVGLVFVAGGAVLVVLPGPLTIPPVLVGVYVWSLEFAWARRLRGRVSDSARTAWEHSKAHPVRAASITVLGLVGAAAVVWAVSAYDLVARARDLIG